MLRLAAAIVTTLLLSAEAVAQSPDTSAAALTSQNSAAPSKPKQRFWWTLGGGRTAEDFAVGHSTLWYSRNELAVGLRSSNASPVSSWDTEYNETALLVGIRPAGTGRLRGLIAGGPAHLNGFTGGGEEGCEFMFSCPEPVPIAPSLGLAFTSELAYTWKYAAVGVSYMGVFGSTISFSGISLVFQIGRP